jgi:hypothetical protein
VSRRETARLHRLRARHRGQPEEDHGHLKPRPDNQPQGCPKANGLPGLPVQAAEEVESLPVDGQSVGGLRPAEDLPCRAAGRSLP